MNQFAVSLNVPSISFFLGTVILLEDVALQCFMVDPLCLCATVHVGSLCVSQLEPFGMLSHFEGRKEIR